MALQIHGLLLALGSRPGGRSTHPGYSALTLAAPRRQALRRATREQLPARLLAHPAPLVGEKRPPRRLALISVIRSGPRSPRRRPRPGAVSLAGGEPERVFPAPRATGSPARDRSGQPRARGPSWGSRYAGCVGICQSALERRRVTVPCVIPVTGEPTDTVEASLPFRSAASALQAGDTAVIMLFHDAGMIALEGASQKRVAFGPPQRFEKSFRAQT